MDTKLIYATGNEVSRWVEIELSGCVYVAPTKFSA